MARGPVTEPLARSGVDWAMPHRNPIPFLVALSGACLSLLGCEERNTVTAPSEASDRAPQRGSYDIDAETGETRAHFTDTEGRTTVLRSGERVPVVLPAKFTVFPGATVVNNTRVEQRDGTVVLLEFESAEPVAELIGFYRKQAESSGIAVDLTIQTGPMAMIGGKANDGSSFSFTATRTGDTTRAQLSVGRGLD